ncbi:MAG TPA: hypothetical protein VKT49_25000 [Bryobacteraceae bacterium]|nr:hypothetical protein [Bryobacteraceae bacterium]
MLSRATRLLGLTIFSLALLAADLSAQGFANRGPQPPQPPRTARQAAPNDLTGYWVSVVTEDWKYRMVNANKGDYAGLPLTDAARRAADSWDPATDPDPVEDCRNYGAPNIMRQPGRIHITWQDDQTLKLETDAGSQTRVFSFESSQRAGGGWQGVSRAAWDSVPGGRGPVLTGSLKVVTTQIKPGFIRSDGVPYSANATLTEYLDRVDFPDGNTYLVVTSTLDDPAYLSAPYMTAVHFRKEADGSGWKPAACR